MELQLAFPKVKLLHMLFFVFMKENGLKKTLLNLNQSLMEDMLLISLSYSNMEL